MPYYLFKMSSPQAIKLVKKLELVEVFDAFRAAGKRAKALRAQNPAAEFDYKVMFAETQLAAEEQLLERRSKPVLMEFER